MPSVTRDEWLARMRRLIDEYSDSLIDWYGETPGHNGTRLPDDVEDEIDAHLEAFNEIVFEIDPVKPTV